MAVVTYNILELLLTPKMDPFISYFPIVIIIIILLS
jgi:hypothetical protein